MPSFHFQPALRTNLICTFAVAVLLLNGCPGRENEKNPVDPRPGATLRLLVVDDPRMADAIRPLRGEWQARMQSKFDVEEMTEADLLTAKTLAADAVIYPSYRLGVLAERGQIVSVPENILTGKDLAGAMCSRPSS